MSLESFIPEIWSARLLVSLRASLIFGQAPVVNRDYEGEINDVGDTVRISSIGSVTINTYAKNTDIAPPQELSDAQTILIIDQMKYFNFAVDDIDRLQQKPKVMGAAMVDAAYNLSAVADSFISSKHAEGSPANRIGTDAAPVSPSATTAYEYLVDLSVKLDEANVPTTGRWVIVPPWFHGLLLKDSRFTQMPSPTGGPVLLNGMVGQAAGFDIMKSNTIPNTAGTLYKIMAGHQMAITFVEQIRKMEAYRPERRFSDAIKGLHLYGAKVIRPEALAVMTANRS